MKIQSDNTVNSTEQYGKIEEVNKYHEAKEKSQTNMPNEYKDKVTISAKARELNQHSEINQVVDTI